MRSFHSVMENSYMRDPASSIHHSGLMGPATTMLKSMHLNIEKRLMSLLCTLISFRFKMIDFIASFIAQ